MSLESGCHRNKGKQSQTRTKNSELQQTLDDESSRVSYHFLFVAEAVVSLSVRREGYFSFGKGQKFDILEDTNDLTGSDSENNLYFARDDNGTIGLVEKRYFLRCAEDVKPILCAKSWYCGGISKEEARKSLSNQAPGCYLVRDSFTRKGSFDIACKMLGDVIFVQIISHSSGYFFLNKRFKALVNIIEHYHKIPIAGNQYLTHPFIR